MILGSVSKLVCVYLAPNHIHLLEFNHRLTTTYICNAKIQVKQIMLHLTTIQAIYQFSRSLAQLHLF